MRLDSFAFVMTHKLRFVGCFPLADSLHYAVLQYLSMLRSPPQQEWTRLLRKHPTLARLFECIDEGIPGIGGQGVCNVAWAANTLKMGSPIFWEKVPPPPHSASL